MAGLPQRLSAGHTPTPQLERNGQELHDTGRPSHPYSNGWGQLRRRKRESVSARRPVVVVVLHATGLSAKGYW
jgi:hypothetical protein